jgi:hypothetical protein
MASHDVHVLWAKLESCASTQMLLHVTVTVWFPLMITIIQPVHAIKNIMGHNVKKHVVTQRYTIHLKQNVFAIPLIIPINQMAHVKQNYVHMVLLIRLEIVIVTRDLSKVMIKSRVWIYVTQIKCTIKISKNVYNRHLVILQ